MATTFIEFAARGIQIGPFTDFWTHLVTHLGTFAYCSTGSILACRLSLLSFTSFIHSFIFWGIKVGFKFHTTFIYLETAYSFQEAVSMLPGSGFKLRFGHFDELLNLVRTDMLIFCTLSTASIHSNPLFTFDLSICKPLQSHSTLHSKTAEIDVKKIWRGQKF